MEKINELINNLEKNFPKDMKLDILAKLESDLKSLNNAINQISEKKKELAGGKEEREAGLSFTSINAEINEIIKKFTNLIDLTKKLETDEALKSFLIQKLNEIFGDISEEASKQFNMSTLEIFNDFLGELKGKTEKRLIGKIEEELFSIKTGLGEFQKVYNLMDKQFSSIPQSISRIQEKYQHQLNLLKIESEIHDEIFPKINSVTTNLTQDYGGIQKELIAKLVSGYQIPLELLKKLREELKLYEKKFENVTGDSLKENQQLKIENQQLKIENQQLKSDNLKMKNELDNFSKELNKLTGELQHLSKEKDKKVETREVLALVMTLLVEVFGAQPHSKLLYLLHGQKADIDRDSLMKASGIAGAAVRKALADLAAAKLVDYDVTTTKVKLLKRIF